MDYPHCPHQNLTGLAIAAAIMPATIAAASLPPALRALRVDPDSALKMDCLPHVVT